MIGYIDYYTTVMLQLPLMGCVFQRDYAGISVLSIWVSLIIHSAQLWLKSQVGLSADTCRLLIRRSPIKIPVESWMKDFYLKLFD